MHFEYSDKVKALLKKLQAFMDEHVYPNEKLHDEQLAAAPYTTPPIVEVL